MTSPVARTCTELVPDQDRGLILTRSQPLNAFDLRRAYVLLGDAGSGKTTEFKREAEALGDAAELLSARDFTTLDVDSHTEWQEKILFIDGLDEMRAGTSDSLTPLDQIRNRLDRLRHPWFRISCREADWLGTNDRQSLAAVSPDKQITVLRLDPLDDNGIRALLTSLDLSGEAEEFIDQARQQGLGAILHNPQTLALLAAAVEQGRKWPDSRQETFELACQKMASEWNEEHLERADHISSVAAMDAAGYLCALQLLAGTEGYSLSRLLDSALFPSDEELQDPPAQLADISLRQALSTRLFTGVVERRVSPVHRHIAEFLAGRYLAKLIENELPVERVLALMTSPSDQRVVTVLRGLSAWLSAHSPTARRRLIALDPVGVGLYGDIKDLSPDEKGQLLESLAMFAEQGPLFGYESIDGGGGWHRRSTAQAFRSLSSADMTDAIREFLTTSGSESRDQRIIGFILEVLAEADETELDSLGELTADVESVLVDPSRPADVKVAALDAYLHFGPPVETQTQILIRLLEETHNGVHDDPLDELRGALLDYLYPAHLAPRRIWQFLASPNERDFPRGRFWKFHKETLLEKSSDQQVGELLDALHETGPPPLARPTGSVLGVLPVQVLARGLEKHGDDVEPARLYNWLSTTSRSLRTHPRASESIHFIRAWLQARPDTQKDVYLTWLRNQHMKGESSLGSYWSCNALNESAPPADFGLWCLELAVQLEHSEPPISLALLNQSYLSLQQQSGSQGLSIEVMKERVVGHNTLASRLDVLCAPPPPNGELATFEREMQDRMAEYEEEKRQRQTEWADLLRSHEDELQDNRLPPRILDVLAHVYFALYTEVDSHALPQSRLSGFFGGDTGLADAAMAALRDAVWRDDIPEAEKTISLHSEARRSLLEYPVLASLDLLDREGQARGGEFDDSFKQKALAIHFFAPSFPGHNAASPYLKRWFQQRPDLVLDVLYQCAVPALRTGETYIPGLNDLDRMSEHSDLVNAMWLRLLEAFPAQAPSTQHEVLDRLIGNMLRQPDTTELELLANKKLTATSMSVAQEVRWQAVVAVVAPNQHIQSLRDFIGDSKKRTRCMAEFFRNCTGESNFDTSYLGPSPDPAILKAFIKILGRIYAPLSESGFVTLEIGTSDRIGNWIGLLGSLTSILAKQALSDLVDDPELVTWRTQLMRAREHQDVVVSDSSYERPSIREVQRTLGGGLPANAADLAAVLNDHLDDISRDIRGSNSNIWRQFWKDDRETEPREPKHEESCRDALLTLLKERLPTAVDSAPERRYASDTRADICVSYGGFNVPIEIKKDSHRDLWSALQEQLVEQYTTDPATSGQGIYLVLWTGGDAISRRPDGNRPTTPDELRELLEGDLTPEQTGKISVRVLDITKP